MILNSLAERAKSCKKDIRYPSLCTVRRATSGENLNNSSVNSEIQIQLSKLPPYFWSIMETTYIANHVAPKTKLYVPKDNALTPQSYIDVQRRKRALRDVMKWMETSHCPNFGSV